MKNKPTNPPPVYAGMIERERAALKAAARTAAGVLMFVAVAMVPVLGMMVWADWFWLVVGRQ